MSPGSRRAGRSSPIERRRADRVRRDARGPSLRTAAGRTRRPEPGGPGPPGVLRVGRDRGRIDALIDGIAELLPPADQDADAPASGSVFKIERGAAGEKIAYVRMFSGTIERRDRVSFGSRTGWQGHRGAGVRRGVAGRRGSRSAGEIGKLWGLAQVRVGDVIGSPVSDPGQHHFAPPTLEAVVAPCREGDSAAAAWQRSASWRSRTRSSTSGRTTSAERSPCRSTARSRQEVIAATLASDFGVDVTFREISTIYIERPIGSGSASRSSKTTPTRPQRRLGFASTQRRAGLGSTSGSASILRRPLTFIYRTADNFIPP